MRKMIEVIIGYSTPKEGEEKMPLKAIFDVASIVNIVESETTIYNDEDEGTTIKVVKINDTSGDSNMVYDKSFEELKHEIFSNANYLGRK